jgi:CheY-like chemotaxis protein
MILLDLNMPRKNGFEVLQEIKADPQFRHIPVVIWTTSRREEDISRTYLLGCNAYMTKPASYDELVEKMKALNRYWFEQSELARAQQGA